MKRKREVSEGYSGLCQAVLAAMVSDYKAPVTARKRYPVKDVGYVISRPEIELFVQSKLFDLYVDCWGQQSPEVARQKFMEVLCPNTIPSATVGRTILQEI